MGSVTADLTTEPFEGLPPSARAVYMALRVDGPMTRTELAGPVGVHINTLSTILPKLTERGVVGKQGAPSEAPGNIQYYAVSPRAAAVEEHP